MATSPIPAPGSLDAAGVAGLSPEQAQAYFANEFIENDYKPWAARTTHDNAMAWQAAQAFPNPPASYDQVSVNTALVFALVTGSDTNAEDWNKVFVHTQFTPPKPAPPPVVQPTGYPVGPQFGDKYLALDGTGYPNGSIWPVLPAVDPRGVFLKHIDPVPMGVSSYWTKQPAS